MIALMAAPIYGVLLADMMTARRERGQEGGPSTDWKNIAMSLAIAEAKLLWHAARQEARKDVNLISE